MAASGSGARFWACVLRYANPQDDPVEVPLTQNELAGAANLSRNSVGTDAATACGAWICRGWLWNDDRSRPGCFASLCRSRIGCGPPGCLNTPARYLRRTGISVRRTNHGVPRGSHDAGPRQIRFSLDSCGQIQMRACSVARSGLRPIISGDRRSSARNRQ